MNKDSKEPVAVENQRLRALQMAFLLVFCLVSMAIVATCTDPLQSRTSGTGGTGDGYPNSSGGVSGLAGAPGLSGSTGSIGTAPTGSIVEFPVPTVGGCPDGITAGPDGSLWFTEFGGDKIGRITLGGDVSEFSLPSGSAPTAITTGGDGNLWFTEMGSIWAPYGVLGGNNIGRITPAGTITEFPVPTARSQPTDIARCPDGSLWFTELWGKNIGSVASVGSLITSAGAIREFRIPSLADGLVGGPNGITCGPDGNLWFTEYSANKIAKMTPSGTIAEFKIPSPLFSGPAHIADGPDGNLWFTESDADKVGRITVTGTITEFPIPTALSSPVGIAAGPDGNLWFAESQGNKIGRMTPVGEVAEFALPNPKSAPANIVAGPDGNLWFTECGGDRIGRIAP